jgi:hypothetical protein
MEQLVIIVIIALISLVNWVMKRSAEIREARRQERERLGIPEGDPFHPEREVVAKPVPSTVGPPAEMRKLMEALGLPMEESKLPEPVFEETPPPLPAPVRPTIFAPRASLRPQPPLTPPPPPPSSPLVEALHSRDRLRQAIILREILGPPKALLRDVSF